MWGSAALHNLAKAMVGQEDAGTAAAMLLRLARYLGGDPAGPINVTAAGVSPSVGLPDLPVANSAVVQVVGNAISYRVDGLDPAQGGGIAVQAGSTLILTGLPTMRAFRFVSAVAASASLVGTYFD